MARAVSASRSARRVVVAALVVLTGATMVVGTTTAGALAAPFSTPPPAASAVAGAELAGAGAAPAGSPPGVVVGFTGHGWGHGRGMGQYGALGYAVNQGWSYHQILDHFYGGTVPGQAAAGALVTVDVTAQDGQDTIVAQSGGLLAVSPPSGVTCAPGAPCAVRIARTGPATWSVYQGSSCATGTTAWKLTATVNTPSVHVSPTAPPSDSVSSMLQLCESDGTRWFRGALWAVDTGSSQATVNDVALESYVQGVVPNESPASWGALGGGDGEQALMAQAVAARSYALADDYAPYAQVCDTTACQLYRGRAFQPTGGTMIDEEGTTQFAATDQAVTATAGEVRVFSAGGGGPAGTIARTEFSSSTGGYTAGGTFPAVPDAGDATTSNPNHAWTTTVPAATIESAFGSGLGMLRSVQVSARNGLGDLGGRVTSMTLQFGGGSVTTTGTAFAASVGLKSNWFAVTAQPLSPVAGAPAPAPAPAPVVPVVPVVPVATGYDVLTSTGSVYAFDGAVAYGSLTLPHGTTAVSLATVPGGYDILSSDGGVHPFGAASSFGSLLGKGLNARPFQVASTPDGKGYWIVASDGGVFSFGDARFLGSTGNLVLNKPVVAMAATPDGGGYWLIASDGGVFSFGDARFLGSTGNLVLNKPVVAMAPTPDGGGYWLIASDGGVFSFGDARFHGSLPGLGVTGRAVALAAPPGGGYMLATAAGYVYGFGTPTAGGASSRGASAPTVDLALGH